MWKQWKDPNQKPPEKARMIAGHPLTTGLIGMWLFNDGGGNIARDYGPNGLHGILTSMDTATAWTMSDRMTALQFDATDDTVVIPEMYPARPETAVTLLGRGTLYAVGNYRKFMNKGRPTAQSPYVEYELCSYSSLSQMQANINVGGTLRQTGAVAVTLRRSYHFASTWSSGDTLKLYIDGVMRNQVGPYTGSITHYDSHLLFGWNTYQEANSQWNGTIEYGAVYDRALSSEEISEVSISPFQMFETEHFSISTFIPRIMTRPARNIFVPRAQVGDVVSPMRKPPPGVPPNPDHDLTQGLVACWLMNENSGNVAADVTGSTGDMILSSTMDPATDWVPGKDGPSIDFDGIDDLAVGGTGILVRGPELTVAMLAMCRTDGEDQFIVSRGANDTARNLLLWGDDVCASGVQGSGNTDTFAFNVGSTSVAGNRVNGATGARVLDTWQHVVGVMKETHRAIYVDGELSGSHSSATETNATTADDQIQLCKWMTTVNADAKVGHVMIWNRALTAEEIRSLSEAPYQMFEPTPSYYEMLQGRGHIVFRNVTLRNVKIGGD